MAYNKAKEEKKWRLWKEAEEKQLRSLGVNEDDIEKLRVHDWTIFNSDRRYYQRVQETGTYFPINLWRWYDEQRRKEMCPISESKY